MFDDVPQISVPDANNVYHPFLDTTIASNAAAASDIAQGKLAYVNGSLVTGTNQGGGGGTVKMGALRPDAELVQTWSYDKKIHADEGVTIPSYNTSAQTLKSSANLSPTYTIEPSTYNYVIIERCLSYPIYSSSAKGSGRFDHFISTNMYEINSNVSGMHKSIVDTSVSSTDTTNSIAASTAVTTCVYWSSSSRLGVSSGSYGPYMGITNPTLSTTTLTIKSPTIYIRGNSSYFNSTYWGYMTDARYQYIIELYRVPITATVKGWERMSQMYHARDCVNSASHTLT